MEESNHDKLQKQIDELRAQGRSDAEFYSLLWRDMRSDMKSMGSDLGNALREVGDRVEKRFDQFAANYDERLRQVEGRQRLKEQRFDAMLKGVATTYATRDELEELTDRVKRLEDRSTS